MRQSATNAAAATARLHTLAGLAARVPTFDDVAGQVMGHGTVTAPRALAYLAPTEDGTLVIAVAATPEDHEPRVMPLWLDLTRRRALRLDEAPNDDWKGLDPVTRPCARPLDWAAFACTGW